MNIGRLNASIGRAAVVLVCVAAFGLAAADSIAQEIGGNPAVPGIPSAPLSAEQIKDAVAAVYADGRIQAAPPVPEPEPERRPRGPGLDLSWLAPILKVLAIGAALVVLALLLRAAYRGNWTWAGKAKKQQSLGLGTTRLAFAPEAPADPELAAIEALAAAGQYGEAVHQLLLLAMARLRQRMEGGLSSSLTSREVARRAKLPVAALKALNLMIGAVEIGHFGQRATDEGNLAAVPKQLLRFG